MLKILLVICFQFYSIVGVNDNINISNFSESQLNSSNKSFMYLSSSLKQDRINQYLGIQIMLPSPILTPNQLSTPIPKPTTSPLPQNTPVSSSLTPSPTPTNTPTATPTPTPTLTPTPMPTPTPTPAQEVTSEPTPTPNPKQPWEKENMNYIEELVKLGYIKYTSDDSFLDERNGVMKFQADSNVEVDGQFGPISMTALRKRLKDGELIYTDTIKTPPTNGYWILINKTNKSLTLYKGNKTINKYPIAVGNPPSLTPEGKFKIVNKVVDPDWGGGGYTNPVKGGTPENPLGYRWMGLDIGGGGAYGIHGNNSPYSIGTYASHGCIRMINSDVESLFDTINIGTPVWITSKDSLSDLGISQEENRLKSE